MISRRRFLQWLASLGIVGAAASAYAFGIEPFSRPRVRRYDLKLNRWPDDLHLTVAAVADVHACKPWMEVERIESIVEQTNNLGADLIVLLGDYAAGHRFVMERVHSDRLVESACGSQGAARGPCHFRQS